MQQRARQQQGQTESPSSQQASTKVTRGSNPDTTVAKIRVAAYNGHPYFSGAFFLGRDFSRSWRLSLKLAHSTSLLRRLYADFMPYHVLAITMAGVRQGALAFQRQLSGLLRESPEIKVYSVSPLTWTNVGDGKSASGETSSTSSMRLPSVRATRSATCCRTRQKFLMTSYLSGEH